MPESFLLSYISFNDDSQPFIDAETEEGIERIPILGQELTLQIDLSEKYCVGWVDFEKKTGVPCPDSATVEVKYESCLKCRNRTGFNPAFYHASSVSEQQEKINAQPHYVYLACFASSNVKVGISQESRGVRRLLEQGARIAVKLDTFDSALIARQYEDRISKLPGFIDHVTGSKKLDLLKLPFDAELAKTEMKNRVSEIEKSLNVSFDKAEIIETEKYFFQEPLDITGAIDMTNTDIITGKVRAVIGAIIITEHDDTLLKYNIKRFIGYRASRITGDFELDLPTEQLTLF